MNLYNFQKQGVRCITHFQGNALLGDEMGLGKTVQAIDWLSKNKSASPALVVCPATAKYVWADTASKHKQMTSLILNGQTPKLSLDNLQEYNPDLYIINYSIFTYWDKLLQKLKLKTLFLDECQKIKNRKAQRTRAIRKFVDRIKFTYVIPISGTPLVNKPIELFTALNLVRPDIFSNWWKFAHRYCNPKLTPWGWDFSGASHTKELHELFHQYVGIRRRKKDVLSDLPPKIRHIIQLDITNRNEYEKASGKDFLKWLKKKSPARARKAAKAKHLVQISYLRNLAAQGKLKAVKQWIRDYQEATSDKLILFGIHHSVLRELYTQYRDTSVIIDGKVSAKAREHAAKRFQNDKDIQFFFGGIISAGTCITLTKAHNLAFLELDFVPGNHLQAEDRPHRISQTHCVNIYYLIARDTIEVKLCQLIHKKQKIITAILDGEETVNDFDVMKTLIKYVNKKGLTA
jgi:SWI/SNF-related matrix-associated actin-dependent regulator 1 of chromatin subfamily A